MTQEELKKIEAALKITLPDYYKNIMLNYPFSLKNKGAYDYELIGNSVKLIQENLEAYKDLWGKPLNKQYLVIGEDGCGDYFLIDLKKDIGVLRFFHDNQEFYLLANSLEEYCALVADSKHEENWGNSNYKTTDLRN